MSEHNAAQRVIEALRASVAAGRPGDQLPSVRDLVAGHQASPLTVQQAMRRLTSEGLIEIRPGRGSFIATPAPSAAPADLSWQAVALGAGRPGEEVLSSLLALPRPEAIPLSGGYLDPQLQPVAALTAALTRAARRPASWARVAVEGREELRAWFAAESGGSLRAGDMIVCSGGQPALATAFRGLGAPGDVLLVESPTYLGAIAAARDARLRVVPVPADHDGVRPDLLAAAFARTGARLFYCQPLHANPHGGILSADRRALVLSAVREAGAFLIEDDWARGLSIDVDPPPPLTADDPDGHVVYVRSLTKVSAPSLRVAAIGARGMAGTRLRTARVLDDFWVAGPLQEAALDFVTSPAWAKHRRALRSGLRQRRDALFGAVGRYLPELLPSRIPAGGLHAWLPLPAGTDDAALTTAAAARGVATFPGRPWFAAEPPQPYLRLTYGGVPPEVVDDGVRLLAEAFRA